jgi:hypothetical protein
MKKIIVLFLAALVFSYCSNKTASTEMNFPQIVTAEDYSKHLDSLDATISSSFLGLEIFQKSFVKENPQENDKALRAYLEFQNKLIGTLEQELFNNTEFYDRLSITYGDSAKTDKDVIAYEGQLKQNGLKLRSAEGSVFMDSDPEKFSEYFGPYVTDGTKEFLQQYSAELNEPYQEDAGLTISVPQLGDRLIFWDKFLTKYPDHIFGDHAEDYYRTFSRTMLTGLDNTLAYDMKSLEWSKEFLDEYQSLVKTYPETQTAKLLSRYLELLSSNDFKYSDKVQAFIEENASYDN